MDFGTREERCPGATIVRSHRLGDLDSCPSQFRRLNMSRVGSSCLIADCFILVPSLLSLGFTGVGFLPTPLPLTMSLKACLQIELKIRMSMHGFGENIIQSMHSLGYPCAELVSW